MTKQASQISAAVEFSRTRQTKTMAKLMAAILGVLLCVLLPGCTSPKGPAVRISLYPDTIGVTAGTTVVLEAQANPAAQSEGWQYQWQQITGQSEDGDLVATNIPGAQSAELILKHVNTGDANLYRCIIYKTGKRAETNYTTALSLQVSGSAMLIVGTPVSGSFKPGNGSGTASCCRNYRDGLIFKNPTTGNWWLPPPGSHSGTATIVDHTTGINYTTTPVFMEVLDDSFTSLKCVRLPAAVSFPSSPNTGYMICLHFTNPLPATGQKFSFTINWP